MEFMPWNDDFITGIDEIDHQHRTLVDMTNALYETINDLDDQAPPLSVTLERLLNYTENHFALEERLFEELGYPESQAHKAEHDKFSGQVRGLLERYQTGEQVSEQTLSLLKHWLSHHILKVDKAYVHFFRVNAPWLSH